MTFGFINNIRKKNKGEGWMDNQMVQYWLIYILYKSMQFF